MRILQEHLKKQQLEKQIEDLKTECEKHKTEITGNKKQVEEVRNPYCYQA